ncbi:MAG: hypothetical protein JO025_28560 [Verrucomicrobia bacterium]|nr:hypothetical protein [Verrucomicrobiota bacterium]
MNDPRRSCWGCSTQCSARPIRSPSRGLSREHGASMQTRGSARASA